MIMTRGERNNNPGNIDRGGGWLGEIGLELVPDGTHYNPRFARFDTDVHGIRAIAKQLLAYQRVHHLETPREFVGRWAPESDHNNDSAYVSNVAKNTGFGPDETLDLDDIQTLTALTKAIILQENGRCIYDESALCGACRLALGLAS